MRICELELRPNEIIQHFKDNNLVSEILKRNNLSLLDVGCKIPWALFELHHNFDFKTIIGLEMNSKKITISEFIQECKPPNSAYKKVYDIYKSILVFNEKERLEGKKHLSESAFNKIFKIHFNTKAEEYFKFSKKEIVYDYVILSHVLHLIREPYRSFVFNSAVSILKPGGLLYVKVNHSENIVAQSSNQMTYNESEFLNLFSHFNEIHCCKNLNDSGKIKSMIYFGIKN